MTTPPDPSASEIAALRETFAHFVVQTAARYALTQQGTEALGEQLARLREDLDALTASPPGGPAAVWFPGLSPEDLTAAREGTAVFLADILRRWYPSYMDEVARCILAHPEGLIELSNLSLEFRRVYPPGRRASLDGAITLHERILPGVIKRLSVITRSCAPGMCSAPGG